MKGWKTYKLSEVAEIKYGKDHKLLSDGDIPVFGSGGIMRYADKAIYDKESILIPRKGTLSNLFYLDKPFWSVDTMFYTKISEGTSGKFLYYLLKNLNLASMNVGSAVPSLTTEVLNKVEINLPDLKSQKQIASILSSLDNKIELNLQMNQTLEAMAQAIFKEWFVNFNFPGSNGKLIDGLPKGWRKYKLTELLDTISSTHKFPKGNAIFLNTSDILEGQFLHEDYSDAEGLPGQAKKSIKKGDILFSEIRPANKRYAFVDFEADDYVVSTKLMVLRSKGIAESIVLYFYIRSQEVLDQLQILAESRSGTFPQITYSELAKLEINIPDEKTLNLFTELIQSIFAKIRVNQMENRTLISIRDSVLSKLMTGQIEVKA